MTNLANQIVEVISLETITSVLAPLRQMCYAVAMTVLAVRVVMVCVEKIAGNDTTVAKRQLKEAAIGCVALYVIPYMFQYIKLIEQLFRSI